MRLSSCDTRGFGANQGAETRRKKTEEDTEAKRARGPRVADTGRSRKTETRVQGQGWGPQDGHRCTGSHRQKDRQT